MTRSIFVLLALGLVACTGDDDAASSSTSSSGGSSSGGSSSGGSASGGSSSGGSSGGSSGTPTDGGTDGSSSGGAGAAALGAGNGVTGTMNGSVKTHTINAQRVPQQTSTALVEAWSAQFPPYDQWRVRFVPTAGTHPCTADVGADDTSIQYNSMNTPANSATTGNPVSSCTINVISVSPKLEGSFTATMQTNTGTVTVTDGYFRVNN